MTQPAEHCGHQPDHVIGQPTECVLRPGHSGSHANKTGMRWWLATLPDETAQPAVDSRHTVDNLINRAEHHGGLTGDEAARLREGISLLTELLHDAEGDRDSWAREARSAEAEVEKLQTERHTYQRAWHSAKDRARKQRTRAEQAEAALDAVRALATNMRDWDGHNPGVDRWATDILAALDAHTA